MINTPFDKCGLEGENRQTLKQDQNYVYLFQNKLCDLYMCHEQLLFLSKPAQTFKELLTFWLFSLFGLPQLDFKVNNSQFYKTPTRKREQNHFVNHCSTDLISSIKFVGQWDFLERKLLGLWRKKALENLKHLTPCVRVWRRLNDIVSDMKNEHVNLFHPFSRSCLLKPRLLSHTRRLKYFLHLIIFR